MQFFFLSICVCVLVWSDNVNLPFKQDAFGIINMPTNNLLKLRELKGFLSAVELLYI